MLSPYPNLPAGFGRLNVEGRLIDSAGGFDSLKVRESSSFGVTIGSLLGSSGDFCVSLLTSSATALDMPWVTVTSGELSLSCIAVSVFCLWISFFLGLIQFV